MKVSDYVAQSLAERGVTHVFYLIGGMITHLVDSFQRQDRVRLVSFHHEQGAAFAAEGLARTTGIPGVAMATSGPGAVNLLTGVGSCFFDSVPAVFITGQVNRNELRGVRGIRQLGFQETDIVSMARPITKAAWQVNDPREVPEVLERAFAFALAGRPGPVLIDLPMDVQRQDIPVPGPRAVGAGAGKTSGGSLDLEAIFRDLGACRAPLILAGGGVRTAGRAEEFREVVAKLGVPVVHSLHGVDALPFGHPHRVGMIGTYGNRWANMALGRCDGLLVLGSRLDIRQTGANTRSFRGTRVIHHVDVDASEINNRVDGCTAHEANLADALVEMVRAAPEWGAARWGGWREEIADLRRQWADVAELKGCCGINPNAAMHLVSRAMRNARGFAVDVGNHQMWAAQSLELHAGQRFLTSGGMGAMGFALPAAIGASMAEPGQQYVVVAGDGGLQCNIQELQTLARNRLAIKIVVLDNASLGMVRQFQESYFASRFEGTQWGYSAPDFVRVAQAYGIAARNAPDEASLAAAVDWLAAADGPALLRIPIEVSTNAYPKLAFGRGITDMEPLAKPVDLMAPKGER
jgi:acetolactate synthase-1/2/3 large subunit